MSPKGGNGPSFQVVMYRVLGTLILLSVILTALPLTVPSMLGFQMYHITSGSMAPAIPTGSVVYVKTVNPEEVRTGDVIAFYRGRDVITHRVVENRFVVGEFVTKGDANAQPDIENPSYSSVIGSVRFSIPLIGNLLIVYSSTIGKIYVLAFAACGAMFHMLAAKIRK